MIGGIARVDSRCAAVRHARRRHGDGRWPQQSWPAPGRFHRRASCGQLKAAYRVIYRSGLTWQEMLDTLRSSSSLTASRRILRVLSGAGKRGFVQERRTPPGAIVRLVRRAKTTDSNTGGKMAGSREQLYRRARRSPPVRHTGSPAEDGPARFYFAEPTLDGRYSPWRPLSVPACLRAAWAAARRAIGTRNGQQLT